MPAKKKDPQIIRKRKGNGGVDAFGLYIDVIVYRADTGALSRQERFFLAGTVLSRYARTRGNKRAAWKARTYSTTEEARTWLANYLANLEASITYKVQTVIDPQVVELTATDVESLAKGEPPYARFAGSVAADAEVGKIDDDTWTPTPAGPF